eukprot:6180399-Pleurochrysis_carterae.AAC.1
MEVPARSAQWPDPSRSMYARVAWVRTRARGSRTVSNGSCVRGVAEAKAADAESARSGVPAAAE